MVAGNGRCSLIPVYAFTAFFLFELFGVLITLSETNDFITQTGGQLCWMYSSISTYITYNLAVAFAKVVSLLLIWRLAILGRCQLYAVVCLLMLASMLSEIALSASACWR